MDARDRERLVVVEERLKHVEDAAAVQRDRLMRLEQLVNTMANNVIEMQADRREREKDFVRVLSIIERQARASESIEVQLHTSLAMINVNAQGAKQVAEKAATHAERSAEEAGRAAQNTSQFKALKEAAGGHSEDGKAWIPRTAEWLHRWPLRAWLGIITLLFLACVALAIVYAIEVKSGKFLPAHSAPNSEHK